jgi:hypothetical protein
MLKWLKRTLWTERFRTRNILIGTALTLPLAFLAYYFLTNHSEGDAFVLALATSGGGLVGSFLWKPSQENRRGSR